MFGHFVVKAINTEGETDLLLVFAGLLQMRSCSEGIRGHLLGFSNSMHGGKSPLEVRMAQRAAAMSLSLSSSMLVDMGHRYSRMATSDRTT